MGESVPVRCPECLRTQAYAAPVFPCACGSPVAPPVAAGATAEPITHRNWTDEWVTVRCGACGREDDWPHPELGCPCGTVLRVPVRAAGDGAEPGASPGPGPAPEARTGTDTGTGAAGGTPGTARRAARPTGSEWFGPGPGNRRDARPGGVAGTPGASGSSGAPGTTGAIAGRTAGGAVAGPTAAGASPGAARTGPGAGSGAQSGAGSEAGSGAGSGTGTGTGTGSGAGSGSPSAAGSPSQSESGSDSGPGPARPPRFAAPRAFAERYPAHIPLPPTAPHPAPVRGAFRPVTIRTSRDAVAAAASYLRWLGFRDVVQPEDRPASGVDLRAPGLVAQVDPSTRPTGLRAVECLWLNGLSASGVSVFFSLAGYTPEARSRAAEIGLPLFVLDLTGTPQPVNNAADDLTAGGA